MDGAVSVVSVDEETTTSRGPDVVGLFMIRRSSEIELRRLMSKHVVISEVRSSTLVATWRLHPPCRFKTDKLGIPLQWHTLYWL